MVKNVNHKIHSELWKTLPWKKFRRKLFRLQKRVWKAVRAGDMAKVRNLQKLILRSRGAKLLAIRQITQLNKGRSTSGIDGRKKLNHKERFQLANDLANVFKWKHQGLRKIPIPKKDGTQRILKVPTIHDRAWQCLVKYAIEPAHEATFHANSYGFRPSRSAFDAAEHLFTLLRSNSNGYKKLIFELDIEKCFDRINHYQLMKKVIAPNNIKTGLWKCLKAGNNVDLAEQGTAQGGVISPLLANIAINGIEEIGETRCPKRYHKVTSCVRYADDMVFVLRPDIPEHSPELIREHIDEFLATRGLNVKESKTHLKASTDGFTFLGWDFIVLPNHKLKIFPSKEGYEAMRSKVKKIANCSNYGAKTKAEKIKKVTRGYLNYHRYTDRSIIDSRLWFLNHATFKKFMKEKNMSRQEANVLILKAFPDVSFSESGYTKIQGARSPFDGDLVYWSKRNSKMYDGYTAKALVKQNHSCGMCGLAFTSDERVELHHIDGKHDNNKQKNLVAVHRSCHQYHHMSKDLS